MQGFMRRDLVKLQSTLFEEEILEKGESVLGWRGTRDAFVAGISMRSSTHSGVREKKQEVNFFK